MRFHLAPNPRESHIWGMSTSDRATTEQLEARQLMAAAVLATSTVAYAGGTMLRINGSAGADTITLTYDGSAYTVTTAAGFRKVLPGSYNAVQIRGAAGNDRITVSPDITTPTFLYGDDGNDTLTGGSGDDNLYGGAGINWLYGMNGRDTLVTIGSNSTDGLTGGADDDTFWVDNKTTENIYDASAQELATSVNKVSAFETSKFVTGTTRTQAISTTLNGTRFRDPDATKGYVYKKFENRPLFSANGPQSSDVKQGQTGDCYFLSTLAATANVMPDTIRNMIVDFGDGTYGVKFKTAANVTRFYRVDNDIAVFNASSTTPAYAGLGQDGAMWVAIAEKAFAYARRLQGSYASISAGWMTETLTALGLNSQSTKWKDTAASSADYLDWVQGKLDAGEVVTVAVMTGNSTLNLVGGHAYQVVRIDTAADGTRTLVLRNPWGIDGYRTDDGNNDGYVTLTQQGAYTGIDAFVSGKKAA